MAYYTLYTRLAYWGVGEFVRHDANLLKRILGFEILPSKEHEWDVSQVLPLPAGWMILSLHRQVLVRDQWMLAFDGLSSPAEE